MGNNGMLLRRHYDKDEQKPVKRAVQTASEKEPKKKPVKRPGRPKKAE